MLTDAGLATAEDRGRERLYALRGEGLAPVHGLLRALAVAQPRVGPDALDALDLEVRRTVRDHRHHHPRSSPHGRRSDDHDSATGRSEVRDGTTYLVLDRTFEAPIESVWAAVTEPDRLARWIGTWTGDPASGQVDFRMLFEGEDAPDEVFSIDECDPPRRLATRHQIPGNDFVWRLELDLTERDGVTTLTFAQVMEDPEVAENVGPGWEYYLDRLVAAEAGRRPSDGRLGRLLPGPVRLLPRACSGPRDVEPVGLLASLEVDGVGQRLDLVEHRPQRGLELGRLGGRPDRQRARRGRRTRRVRRRNGSS